LCLELGVGERHVRVALARGLEVFAAPSVVRFDRDARGAPRRKCRVELGSRAIFHAPHQRARDGVLQPRRFETRQAARCRE